MNKTDYFDSENGPIERRENGNFYPYGPGPTRPPMLSFTGIVVGAALGAVAAHFALRSKG